MTESTKLSGMATGDVMRLTLDASAGRLTVTKNGESYATFTQVHNGPELRGLTWHPIVTLDHNDEQATVDFGPPATTGGSGSTTSSSASAASSASGARQSPPHASAASAAAPNAAVAEAEAHLNTLLAGEAGLPWKHCRLVLVGQGGVGKTSVINALSGKPFDAHSASTIGAETQTLQLDRKEFVTRGGSKSDPTGGAPLTAYTPDAMEVVLSAAAAADLARGKAAVEEGGVHPIRGRHGP